MSAEPMSTQMAVLAKALPKRILLVDDDELELELMANRLKSIGFEVTTAANGHEAIALLERRWFPVVITDREMPVMGGIELTERLRNRGVGDTYVIMLTVRDSGLDYERGYLAGVDDYLTKKLPDAELLARVQKGFATLAMRRSLQQAQSQLQLADSHIDTGSGAYTSDYLMTSLLAECRRAERYQRNLAILTVGVALNPRGAGARALPDEAFALIVDTLRAVIRSHVDWIARASSSGDTAVFVLVLPEASAADAVGIKNRIQNALRVLAETADVPALRQVQFTFGFAALDLAAPERRPVEPAGFVAVAEQCRSCLQSRGNRQLAAVQASVAAAVAICCRQGYAVDAHCHFMGEAHLPRVVTDQA